MATTYLFVGTACIFFTLIFSLESLKTKIEWFLFPIGQGTVLFGKKNKGFYAIVIRKLDKFN